MALTNCPDCSGQVSSTAPACPHCGRPMMRAPVVQRVNTKHPGFVACKVIGALAMLVGVVSCAAAQNVVVGLIGLVGGMLLFVVGRFGD